MDIAGGSPRALTPDFDFDVDDLGWDGSRGLFFHYDDHGVTKIGWVGADGGKVADARRRLRRHTDGPAVQRRRDVGAPRAASPTRAAPSTGRPMSRIVERGGKPRSLTDLNANLLGHKQLGKVEEMHVKSSADGRESKPGS